MNEQSELSEKRASIYWWFATLLVHELNDGQIATLNSETGQEFLEAFSTEGMKTEVEAVKSALNRLTLNGKLQLELAADYAQTFLRDHKHSALPYASAFLSQDGLLYQAAHKEMTDLLQQEGLDVDKNLGEPADHIAVQLDYLGNLILRGVETSDDNEYRKALKKQLGFIDTQLMNWVPLFVKKSATIENAHFYPSLCTLLLSFLRQDRAYLVSRA